MPQYLVFCNRGVKCVRLIDVSTQQVLRQPDLGTKLVHGSIIPPEMKEVQTVRQKATPCPDRSIT